MGNNFIGNNLGVDGSLIAGAPNAHGSFIGSSAAPLDPLLGPLTDNGNLGQVSTLTHANLPNNGNNGVRDRGQDAGAPTTDERGLPRVSGAHTDIGAFEFQNPDMAVTCQRPHRDDPGRLTALSQHCRHEQRAEHLQRRGARRYPAGQHDRRDRFGRLFGQRQSSSTSPCPIWRNQRMQRSH